MGREGGCEMDNVGYDGINELDEAAAGDKGEGR